MGAYCYFIQCKSMSQLGHWKQCTPCVADILSLQLWRERDVDGQMQLLSGVFSLHSDQFEVLLNFLLILSCTAHSRLCIPLTCVERKSVQTQIKIPYTQTLTAESLMAFFSGQSANLYIYSNTMTKKKMVEQACKNTNVILKHHSQTLIT